MGAHGAGVNKIRESLGVKVDFSDDHDEKEKEVGKKKKVAAGQKVKVKVGMFGQLVGKVSLKLDITRSPVVRRTSRRPSGASFPRPRDSYVPFQPPLIDSC